MFVQSLLRFAAKWSKAVNGLHDDTDAASGLRRMSTLVGCIIVLVVLFAPPWATAQTVSDQDRARLEAEKASLFEQMLRDPANLDVAFAYADVSGRLGDYEAAVSTLERMLLFNPNLPRVQLELGALYFRMGSYGLARAYFARALAANPPPEVRARVDQYLAEIEKSESRHHLTGYVFFGGQYQSDANVAPGSPLILSPIGPVLLNSQFTRQASGAYSAAARCSTATIWGRRTAIRWMSPASVTSTITSTRQ